MSKPEKFVFQDLPIQAVVNKVADLLPPTPQDEIIDNVVAQHLEAIVLDSSTSEAHESSSLDIEQIKSESYAAGKKDAETEMRSAMEQLKAEFHLSSMLQDKLNLITKSVDIEGQMALLIRDLIQNIARKLYLVLPMDFEQLFLGEISAIIKKFYKEGKITVRVHANMVDHCNNLLGSANLSSNNVDIVVDEDLCLNDCVVEWGETRLEYTQEHIVNEVERIVTQLQSK